MNKAYIDGAPKPSHHQISIQKISLLRQRESKLTKSHYTEQHFECATASQKSALL